jgi:hypothetical protein
MYGFYACARLKTLRFAHSRGKILDFFSLATGPKAA